MYKYRIIVTNPGSVSEQYVVQSSYNGGDWNTMSAFSRLPDAERFYDDVVKQHTDTYGYRIIKSQ